jgi:hypothetical protein
MSQRGTARLAFALLALGALIAVAAVAGVRLGRFAYEDGWRLMIPATVLGLAALGAALAWLAAALRNNDRAGRGAGLVALIGSLLFLWPPVSTYFHRLTSPPIHDFTTDTASPPRFVALLKFRGPADNPPAFNGDAPVPAPLLDIAAPGAIRGKTQSLSEVLHNRYRDLLKPQEGFAFGSKDPAATFFWRDFEAAKKTGWTIVDYSARDGRIEATHASFWFGRISDIVIRARRAGTGARTDVRSQSRNDAVDDGANAANVRHILSFLVH